MDMDYTLSLDQYSITIETNKHVNGERLKYDQLNWIKIWSTDNKNLICFNVI